MEDIEKFKYLQRFLVKDAADAIAGIELSNANYTVAKNLLEEQFGNKEIAKFAHLEKLMAVPSAENNPNKLKEVYTTCESHIRSLVALGMPESTFGEVFTPIILSKLPRATRIQLHRANGGKPWVFANLRELLKAEIQVREMSDRLQSSYGDSKPQHEKPQQHNPPSSHAKGSGANKPKSKWSTQGAMVATASKGHSVTCSFCNQAHYSDQCMQFPTVADRKRALNGRCFKCLGNAHLAADCRRGRPCYFCSELSHHSSLCEAEFGGGYNKKWGGSGGKSGYKGSSKPAAPHHTGVQNAAPIHSSTSAKRTPVVMKMASIQFDSNRVTGRAYLDDGSTTSYITTDFAKRLDIVPSHQEFISVDTLADTQELVHIDILIGGDYLHELTTGERIQLDEGLYLYGSKLGYVVAGRLDGEAVEGEVTATVLLRPEAEVQGSNFNVERFWSLEDIGVKDNPYKGDGKVALENFQKSIVKSEGRYEVALPWREEKPDLQTNFGLAVGRLRSVCARLAQQPDRLKQYDEVFQGYLKDGIAEVVRPKAEGKPDLVSYLPHHFVLRDSATTPLRVVFDASAKTRTSNLSLNECLYRGPVMLQDLCGILLRFRIPTIAITCDIKQAFLQVRIQEKDRNVLRFLWLKNPNRPATKGNVVVLRLCSVPFGTVASPLLLAATIQHHLSLHDSKAAATINENLYVDNVIVGVDSVQNGQVFHSEATRIFAELSMPLRQWYANSVTFMQGVPEAEKGLKSKPKVLGIPWDVNADTIGCVGLEADTVPPRTKREVLSEMSKVYDPCGMFAPTVIQAKIFVQNLWAANVAWDEQLPTDSVAEFADIRCSLSEIPLKTLPRRINQFVDSPGATHEIHCFCEASKLAYGACVYIKSTNELGKTDAGLAFAKARLAPLKPKSLEIPRLELMAAVVGVRITNFAIKELHLPVSSVTIWSDSKCVLRWFHSKKTLAVFVQNRVRELRAAESFTYRYVPSACNPADIASARDLGDSQLWWKGPSFLMLNPSCWPENEFTVDPSVNLEIERGFAVGQTTLQLDQTESIGIQTLVDPTAYSSWWQLLRVTACLIRAKHLFLRKIRGDQVPAAAAITAAQILWLKFSQNSGTQDWSTPNSPVQRNLRVFTDEVGLIRCKGRLQHSDLSCSAKAPVLLPNIHPVTNLVIQAFHEQNAHAGVSHTLASIRKYYWVIHGRAQVRKAISRCPTCKRVDGGHFMVPESPALPCCVVRAIHLDVVTELSAEQFLLCFRRFASIFGLPKMIVSDNAKQFKLANSVFKRALENSRDGTGIEWKFIVELAPCMGGFYERLVDTVKKAIRKTLGVRQLTFLQLQTAIYEIAAIVNSRPLVPLDSEPGQLALTPAQFLGRRREPGVLEIRTLRNPRDGVATTTAQQLIQSWKKGQDLLGQFWTTWRNEYLATLRERPAVQFNQRNASDNPIKVGAVVLIKEPQVTRCKWKMGLIESLIQSQDGTCRSVRLRTTTGNVINRPVKLLYPIEQAAVDVRVTQDRRSQRNLQSVAPRTAAPSAPTGGSDSDEEFEY